jgi:ribosomal protein L7/L12
MTCHRRNVHHARLLAHAKADAIKRARSLFGLNLRDAKNLIESRMRMLEDVDIDARLAALRNMEHV